MLELQQCEFQCEIPPTELTVCLQYDDDLSCRSFNITEKVTISGKVDSWRDGDTCGHTWYDGQFKEQVFRNLTCPSEWCPMQCEVEETLKCTNLDDPSNNVITFWIYFALRMSASFFLASSFTMMVETSSKTLLQDLKELVTKVEIDLFLVMMLLLGCNWGFIESYLFVFLKELNAPNYLLGLTMTVGCLVGIPVMFVADWVVRMLGRPVIFIISFFTYTLRHFGYAYMANPWMVFPFEVLEVFTFQLMWVAGVTYCPVLAPKGLLATMTGLVGCTHYSLGRGVGSLLGGYLITVFGLPGAFRTFGLISLTSGVLYVLLHFCFLKKRLAAKEEENAENKEIEDKEEGKPMLEETCPAAIVLPATTANSRHTPDSTSTSTSL
ncbi:major facilitator superfamily domain-containing protein 6-like [Panulirus ornatus]|uniref:major facilitator superfamily domain-containing protein 6-like n=1 Tax=Panulirus ornatus TaxID=150431 RepID=UPI003A84AEF8